MDNIDLDDKKYILEKNFEELAEDEGIRDFRSNSRSGVDLLWYFKKQTENQQEFQDTEEILGIKQDPIMEMIIVLM